MKRPSLKEMLQNERQMDPLFHKGRQRVLMMVLIYLAARFSDPIVSSLLSKTPPQLKADLIFGLFVAVYIGWSAMLGSVKMAGILCLLTPVGNTMAMVLAAKGYSGGLAEMLRRAPVAWYILAISVVCGAAGIVLLTDRTVAAFGKRRKEIQREYADALSIWANESRHTDEADSEHPRPEAVNPPEKQPDVHRQEPVQDTPLRTEAQIQKEADGPAEQEPAAEKAPGEREEKAKEELRRRSIAEHLTELEAEPFTLIASSIPNAFAKVSKQRFFDLFREMVCKEFGCREEQVDPATYILVFPENKLARMRWLPEEKKICIESNTQRYGAEFHALMLSVVGYLSKNMGVKFAISDIDESRKVSDQAHTDPPSLL